MSSILWHDYETFGADPALDRPSQFAAVRTNLNLEPVGDPVMLYCRPSEDLIPNIDACLITGITPQEAVEKGSIEPEFIKQVHAEFMVPGTCGAGYNSIRFDDEVTRHCLYRNFYDPYAREWQNGNSRWDIIDMVRATYALRPEGIAWPESEPGIPSFRLELLTEANGLDHGAAHDALSDVYATIALAQLIRDKQPKLYGYLWDLKDKRKAAQLLDINSKKPVVHVSSKIPASRGCTTIVMPFAQHPENGNGIICIDLSVDPDVWTHLSAEQMLERLYKKSDELADGEERLPIKTVHLNRAPVVVPLSLLDGSVQRRLKIDVSACEQHWQKLLSETELADKLRSIFQQPFDDERDVEASLYSGFIPRTDRALCDQIIRASADELESNQFVFADPRLTELLFRYRARHFPETLKQEELLLWREEVTEKNFSSYEGVPSAYDTYMAELNQRRAEENSQRDQNILDQLNRWMLDFHQRYYKA